MVYSSKDPAWPSMVTSVIGELSVIGWLASAVARSSTLGPRGGSIVPAYGLQGSAYRLSTTVTITPQPVGRVGRSLVDRGAVIVVAGPRPSSPRRTVIETRNGNGSPMTYLPGGIAAPAAGAAGWRQREVWPSARAWPTAWRLAAQRSAPSRHLVPGKTFTPTTTAATTAAAASAIRSGVHRIGPPRRPPGPTLWGRGELVEHAVQDAVREHGDAALQPRPNDAGRPRDRSSLGYLPRGGPRVGVERRTQPAHRVMKSGTDRPEGNAEGLGNLLERQIEVVVQHHDRTMVDGQSPESTLELIAVDDRAEPVRRRRLVSRQETEVGRPVTGSASLRVAGADEKPIRPGIKSCRVAELRQVSPDAQAASAASHPRQGRCRAGSCAPRREDGRRQRPRGSRMPPGHPVAPAPRCPSPSPSARSAPISPALHTGMGGETRSSGGPIFAGRRAGATSGSGFGGSSISNVSRIGTSGRKTTTIAATIAAARCRPRSSTRSRSRPSRRSPGRCPGSAAATNAC